MSNEIFVIFIIAAVSIIAIAQYTPLRLWYVWQMKFFDLNGFQSRIGQVGVVIIAAGIIDGVFADGSTGEVVSITVFGTGLILFSSFKRIEK